MENAQLAFARAYKGEGKSALLRITRQHLEEALEADAILLAKTATEIVPDLTSDDYAAWTKAWKASIFGLLANEIGSRIGLAWSDDAMTLVDQAEKNGFRQRGIVGSIIDRLSGASVEVSGAKISIPQRRTPELTTVAGAVARRAKNVPAVWVLVDDLDKNFENTRLQRTKIASFFDAVREMVGRVPELRIRAAIRPNVWTAIKVEFESLSHVEQYVFDLTWSEEDARHLIARRIEGYLARSAKLPAIANDLASAGRERERDLIGLVFEPAMPWGTGTRPPHVLIYTLSKHRPRWMVELCKVAAAHASKAGHRLITHEDLISELAEFGDRRIQDTIAEFKSQCGQIEELISAFNRQPEQMTTAELLNVIEKRILPHVEVRISGTPGQPKALHVAGFLFEIGFMFGRRDHPDGNYEHVTFSEKPHLFRSRTRYGIWIDYCDEAGRRHRESLATADRDEAKAKADDTAAKFRREAKRQPQERTDIALAELIDIYDREVTSRKSVVRQRYERRTFELFRKQFGAQRLVKTLSRRDWDAYIAARQSGQLRPAAVSVKRSVRNQIIRHDLTLLGMILSWACDAGDGSGGFLLDRSPLRIKRKNGESGVLLPKELSAKRPVLSAKQFDAVRGAASGESSAAESFVVLAWRTGHRANSIRHLRWSDVDLEGNRVHWCAEHDKVGREHITPMHPDVSAVLHREWQIAEVLGATTESWVFPAQQDESEPIGRDTLNKWWQRFAKAAELPKGQGYGWHSCRRGFANRLHRAGVALKDLQGLGGWKTSATLVEVYLQPDEEAQRRALALDDSA